MNFILLHETYNLELYITEKYICISNQIYATKSQYTNKTQ